jgi:hypothetical protein
MVQNGTILTVAENEVTSTGSVAVMQAFIGAGTANLDNNNVPGYVPGGSPYVNSIILTGAAPIQTPGGTPVPFVPVTINLQGPQGFVNPGGNAPGAWSAVLDQAPGGSAILYAGYYSDAGGTQGWSTTTPPQNETYMPYFSNSYGGAVLNNPKGMCDDGTGPAGHIYVTDTGNHEVEEFSPYEGIAGLEPLPIHQWYGAQGVTVGGTGVVFSQAAVSFKSPYAVACDNAKNVWVGDAGYSPSMIMEFTSGATTILESWPGVSGCVVHGLAIDSGTGNVYVADSGNRLVEVYSPTGSLITEFGDPGPSADEVAPFAPSCIAFSGGFIYVGDTANDYIDVFQ